jgi:hypothetical protein
MIALITTIWKRHELTEIVFKYYKEIAKKYDLILIAAGSEGEESRKAAKGWKYIEVDNYPLTYKHNALLSEARNYNPDGVILIGSDDLIAKEQFDLYFSFTPDESKYIGFSSCYFYDTEEKQMRYFKGYGQTIGAGRYFSKKVLDKCDWQLWEGEQNKSLDANCKRRLASLGIQEEKITGGCIIDIKHEANLTNIKAFDLKTVKTEIMAKKTTKKTAAKVEKLEPVNDKILIQPKIEKKKPVVKVQYIKDAAGILKGTVKELPIILANQLVKLGVAKWEN